MPLTSTTKYVQSVRKKTEVQDDVVRIHEKSANGINAASVQRGDNIVVTAGCEVHSDCRKWYTNPRDIEYSLNRSKGETTSLKRSARVSLGPFDSKSDCFFCGTKVVFCSSDYSCVQTDSFAKTILQCCGDRTDDWGFAVKGRIEYYGGDLHAADCVYHHSCYGNFRSGLDIPQKFRDEPKAQRRKSGRPKDEDREQAFSKMCSYLEANDEEQLTISALGDKMKEFLCGEDSLQYGNQYLKSKLRERYGDSIYIAEGEGLHDIVTMREKTSQILRSYFKSVKESDEESQKRTIIETAVRLIKSDIKTEVSSVTVQYPGTDMLKLDTALQYLPGTLRTMLDFLFVGKDKRRKVAGIGQAIIQAVRPRAVLVSLQIGLAIQTHHLYRSRFIVDTLYQMGFSSSYGEVLRFEKNAADTVAVDKLGENVDSQGMAVLFAGDNVDHNILTIDGKGTFHGMGMIAPLTPGRKPNQIIPRQSISELKYTEKTKIDIVEYRFASHARRIVFKELLKSSKCDRTIDVL